MPEPGRSDDVAVVGVGLRVPPDTTGVEAFWAFLEGRGDAVGEVPADRWSWRAFYDPDPAKPGRMDMARGAFLRQRIEAFDAAFFGVSPREAAQLDPQQRLLLEVSWEALEDAGADVWSLRGSATGVFVGAFMLDVMMQRADPRSRDSIGPQTALTCTNTVLASRLSYVYDLRGPAMAIDTACSSSLVAIHQAVRALREGDCDLALAGGVNRIFRPEPSLMMSKGRFLAPDGRSKSFSARGDGYGRGEGCGVVVLKRLEDALRDGERIYAVVEGSGVNQDGRTGGPALPSSAAQADLMAAVAARVGAAPGSVAYVEAHGTGTAVGDPAEMAAIGEAFGRAAGRAAPCVVGSVKAGIGHLEGAAGVVGFVKAALVAQRRVVPPQAWLDELNPDIPFDELGLAVAVDGAKLDVGDGPLRVAVNSFGYGGTNAHALLRSPPGAPGELLGRVHAPDGAPASPRLEGFFPPVTLLSGHTEDAVRALAGACAEQVREEGPVPELLAAYAARTVHEHRRAVVGDPQELADRLDQLAAGGAHPDILAGRAAGNRAVRPVFVFSGMGPQWWAMGRSLLTDHPTFRAHAERCDEVFRQLAGWSVLDALLAPEAESQMARTEVAQPATVVLQTGLAAVLAELGIRPAAVIGHSVGEVAAAHVAGALGLEDALTVAFHRSRLQARTAGTGGMLATDLGEEEARALLGGRVDVSLAAVNGPSAVTLAGDVATLEGLRARLEAESRFCRLLRVEVAYHSPTMEPILGELSEALAGLQPRPTETPRYSTVDVEADSAPWDAAYWARNVRDPVAFHAAAGRALADGRRLFVEIGPHPVLGIYLQPMLTPAKGGRSVPTLHRGRADGEALLDAALQLWLRGVQVDWAPIFGRRRAAGLPPYPWQRQHHWQESDEARRARTGVNEGRDATALGPLHGLLVTDAPPTRDLELSPTTLPWVRSHTVAGETVFPATGYLEALLADVRARAGGAFPVAVDDVRIERPLVLPERQDPLLRVTADGDGGLTISSRERGATPGPWRTHARGRVGRGRLAPLAPDPARPLSRAEPSAPGEVAALYDALDALGLRYEADFRAVAGLRVGDDHTEVEVVSPTPVPQGYTAYPPLLDAALHGALVTLLTEADELFVPVRVRRVVAYGELGSRAFARGRLVGSGPRHREVDIDVVAPDGRPAIRLQGVELRRVAHASTTEAWLDERTYEPVWASALTVGDEARPARPGRWSVVGAGARAEALRAALDARKAGSPGEGLLVDLRDVAAGGAEPGIVAAERVREVVQASSGSGVSEVVLVTEGAVAASPDDRVAGWALGWVAGFRRVAANESDSVRFRHVDVDVDDDGSDDALAAAVAERDDEEFAMRRGELLHPLVTHRTSVEAAASWWAAAPAWDVSEVDGYRFAGTGPGLSATAWVAEPRRPPRPHEVELRVEAVGLNHKDVLKQLGVVDEAMSARSYFGAELGMEQCVVVERVGDEVAGLVPGQRLLAGLRGGFRRYVVVDPREARLLPCRPEWSAPEAAGVLIAFFSAHRALAELARVEAGEVVLVHGATGGFGQAALQVARDLGARVFATAGTPEKRALLASLGAEATFGSRTLDFVEEVRAATGGHGVDVVLNTLPAGGLQAALEAVAEDGRVVEIGKHELAGEASLPLHLLDRNVTVTSFDLDYYTRDRERVLALGDRVLARFTAGAYRPVPTTAVPAAEASSALARMARSEHTGKLVVDLDDTAGLRCREPRRPAGPVRPDRSYVVTGGTGALGLEAASWLARRGARHIALLSRAGKVPEGDTVAQRALAALGDAGVAVHLRAVDVTDREALDAALASIRREAGPIGGVVHAAGIAHDLPLLALGPDDMRVVLAPKLAGAWHLHEATLDDPIELFLMTSSVSALTGTSGQAPYAAANAALEAFAHWRRRKRLPAIALALGPVADVGMAALTDEIARYVRVYGFDPLPPGRLGAILDRVVAWNRPVLAVFDVDWEQWKLAEPHAAASARFAPLVRAQERPQATWDRLASLPDGERVDALAQIVADGLATVLDSEPGEITPDTALASLGLDSLMLIELQTHLNQAVGAELSLMGLLGIDTVQDAARRIDHRLTRPPSL